MTPTARCQGCRTSYPGLSRFCPQCGLANPDAAPPRRSTLLSRIATGLSGVGFVALAVWLDATFLPRHRPIAYTPDVLNVLTSPNDWFLSANAYLLSWVTASLIAVLGLWQLGVALVWHGLVKTSCNSCGGNVLAYHELLGLRCPNSSAGHYASFHRSRLLLLAFIVATAAACALDTILVFSPTVIETPITLAPRPVRLTVL